MEEQVACLRRLQVAYEEGREAGRERDRSNGEAEGDRHGTGEHKIGQDSKQIGRQADRQVGG